MNNENRERLAALEKELKATAPEQYSDYKSYLFVCELVDFEPAPEHVFSNIQWLTKQHQMVWMFAALNDYHRIALELYNKAESIHLSKAEQAKILRGRINSIDVENLSFDDGVHVDVFADTVAQVLSRESLAA